MDTSMSTSSAVMTMNYSSGYQSPSATILNSSASSTTDSVAKAIANVITSAAIVKQPPTMQELKDLVDEGNALFKNAGSNLQFQIDDSTDQVVVKIIDSETNEVVRQIPTVEMLDFIRAMKEQERKTGKIYQAVV